ncbi:MAG: adenylosuccinate synthase, partial [Firmicutes bacterium]|nr:adenylosuccinate synthase [Bacillota bacterium]
MNNQYNTTAIVGAQWGDEGKGKVIDILSGTSDMVVRSQGGNNAGHTVVVGDKVHKLHLVPSGILYKGCQCVIGAGTVIDPKSLLQEMDSLAQNGLSFENLHIDARAHIVFPYHILLDGISESQKGDQMIGTTKKGIGPCYMDKAERIGLRMQDTLDLEKFKSKLKAVISHKNKILKDIYHTDTVDFYRIFDEYAEYVQKLKPYIKDTSLLVYEAIKAGKKVLFEGAQGTLLDINFGTYPFVTSSHPITGGVATGAGIGPTMITECLGIAKAYTTRVGMGPFPTELLDEIGEKIQTVGKEVGTTTGRARRCGWLDAVILRYSVRINGLTALCVNKLDTLTGIPKLKICTAYKL